MKELLFAAVVFTTFCIQGVTGFGSTVLALPFVIRLEDDPRVTVPVLTILSIIFCGVFLMKDRSHIAWGKIGGMIFYLALGGPFGVFFLKTLPRGVFAPILGAVIVVIAIWGLLRACSERFSRFSVGPWCSRALLIVGGAVQGAFGSGGPFVMLHAEQVFKDKSEFRTSLLALWFVSNLIVAPQYFVAGIDARRVLALVALCTPAVLLGLLLSVAIHKKLNLKGFLILLYSFLLAAGVFTLASAC